MRGRLVITSLGVIAAVIVAGCDAGSIPFIRAGHSAPGGNWVVIADVSLDSTSKSRVEAGRIVERVALLAAKEEGTLAFAVFQRNALSTIDWPVSHRFSPRPSIPSGNSFLRDRDLQAQARDVSRIASVLLEGQRKFVGTDIVGAAWASSDRFAAAGDGPKTLVLGSNMLAVSQSDGLRMTEQRLDDPQVANLLDQLDRRHRIPPLRGVCVYVVGAGLDPGARISTAKVLQVRKFWMGFFQRAGAQLVAWEPTLSATPTCE